MYFIVTRLELENRLSELEQQRALHEATGNSQKEEWEERLRAAQLGEESVRKELQNLRQVSRGSFIFLLKSTLNQNEPYLLPIRLIGKIKSRLCC